MPLFLTSSPKIIVVFLTLFIFLASSDTANAAQDCGQFKRSNPHLDLRLELVEDPYYDFSMTTKELNKNKDQVKENWIKKNGMTEIWRSDDMQIRGVAVTGMGMASRYSIRPVSVDSYGVYACLYFDVVNLELFYRTLIAIPKELPQGSCDFHYVHEHELKHHEVNKAVVRKYYDAFQRDIKEIIATIENQPYAHRHNYEQQIEDMKLALEGAIYVYLADMLREELKERNHHVDTPDEYRSVQQKIEDCKKKAKG